MIKFWPHLYFCLTMFPKNVRTVCTNKETVNVRIGKRLLFPCCYLIKVKFYLICPLFTLEGLEAYQSIISRWHQSLGQMPRVRTIASRIEFWIFIDLCYSLSAKKRVVDHVTVVHGSPYLSQVCSQLLGSLYWRSYEYHADVTLPSLHDVPRTREGFFQFTNHDVQHLLVLDKRVMS